jgi:hypothetical protein
MQSHEFGKVDDVATCCAMTSITPTYCQELTEVRGGW